uniref:procollagen-proline 3-dioxygenase n=1 Tax=Gouania willdenowi TaxID=441366 RepID=A0A8C5HGH1_GOUWI
LFLHLYYLLLLLLLFTLMFHGVGSPQSSSLLQPYDFLYYSGVRAYFSGDWSRAAELLEKSIETKQTLLKVQRNCYQTCEEAGSHSFKVVTSGDTIHTVRDSLWDLWLLDGVQQKAECLRFCTGRHITPTAQLPVSTDIDYEFGTRNPYNFLQVTYYKLEKLQKAAAAAHTYFVANPSHLEMRNNIEKYRRMEGVTDDDFQDREVENEIHWASSDWTQAAEKWKACVNETLRLIEDCRVLCEVAPQHLPEDRGVDSLDGAFEKAAGDLSLLSCRHYCVTQVATRPGRISFSIVKHDLYYETLGGDTESPETQPEIVSYVQRSLQEKKLLYFGVENLDFSFTDPVRGPIHQVGVTITMDDEVMNGTNRVVLDGVMTEKECDRILHLATVSASVGDGYGGRRSPHTPHETFEGLTVLRAVKLAQQGLVNHSDAQLLHELGERVRVLLHSYFRSPSGLFISFTHLVCRSAVAGEQEGRLDLSHPVHVDNCLLEPGTNQCWKEPPAFIHRDLSAVLYLNDNFEGGELFFTNRDTKTITARVKPSCGRLVGFSSGPVNPHGVTAVNSGRRCALALWFTKEKKKGLFYLNLSFFTVQEREEAEDLWIADGHAALNKDEREPEGSTTAARNTRNAQIPKEGSRGRGRVTGGRDEL